MKALLKTVALAGLLGTGLMLAGTTSASASYLRTACNGDGLCRTVECNNDGDNCITLRYFHRYGDRRYYNDSSYYDYDSDNYPYRATRHWVCNSDGEDCHWSYD